MATHHALLFTDVVDSTRLVERLGDGRVRGVGRARPPRARAPGGRRGREIDRTDGFFLLFDARRRRGALRARVPRRRWRELALRARVRPACRAR